MKRLRLCQGLISLERVQFPPAVCRGCFLPGISEIQEGIHSAVEGCNR